MKAPDGWLYVVTAPSAYRLSVECIVGEGSTEAAAWAEVIPAEHWEAANTFAKLKRLLGRWESKGYVCKLVTEAEWRAMWEAFNNE